MINIALQGAEFFAYHGFYPEEQKIGCRFLVDIAVGFEPVADLKDGLHNTVDYEKVYAMACEEMKIPSKLIETVGQAITNRIQSKYPFVKTIQVTIKKLNPPLTGRVAQSSVTINYPPAI
ncbi:dihydroneopterin aldolase [Mucilaginibacter sp. OK268]|jgi:dihydroneopterin aldolase|uniref:dihydroneopterin aldolase n=1 Tax=Mucilaginibacter sp. OK268 TaxID=1881048 RepID=UPI00089045FD|nr:dihydroneopterin aldolase [Mucilaginibacter sp. OK268]SDP92935.1 dihydroneopterin aldolase [Mucilaginibacter sp. OK268]